MNIVEYYRDKHVRERMSEYCGGYGGRPETFTSAYLVGYGPQIFANGKHHHAVPNEKFGWILDSGLDIFRSIWDYRYLILALDVEYFNMDYPAEILLFPKRAFAKLMPVHNTIEKILLSYSISHITVMTGQGFHYVSKIPINSDLFESLVEIGHIEDTLRDRYQQLRKPFPSGLGEAYDAAGKLVEFLAHMIIKESHGKTIPVYISDIAPPRGPNGREGISLDLTMYGDPIYKRDIRLPFSTHQKHLVKRWYYGVYVARMVPVRVSLPFREKISELFVIRENMELAAEYAARVSGEIPVELDGWEKLMEDYLNSDLAKFHEEFDSVAHDPWTEWHRTYRAFRYEWLPPCVKHVLNNPNPELLKPTQIQLVTRVLMSLGWHPKHIAGYIRSVYESDRGWGNMWYKHDAATRANWWVRVYAGMIATGLDEAVDLNCVSHKERGFCVANSCNHNLACFRKSLQKRTHSISLSTIS